MVGIVIQYQGGIMYPLLSLLINFKKMDNPNLNNQVPPAPPTPPVPPVNNQVPPVNNTGGQVSPKGLMQTLEYYFVTKAPFQIPPNVKEIIVKYGPWIQVIFLVTLIPIIFALIGLGTMFSAYTPYAYGYGAWSISSIISLVVFVLSIIALPGLFRRKISGWNMSFYGIILNLIGSLISGYFIGAIIGFVIGGYVWFQIRSYYN